MLVLVDPLTNKSYFTPAFTLVVPALRSCAGKYLERGQKGALLFVRR